LQQKNWHHIWLEHKMPKEKVIDSFMRAAKDAHPLAKSDTEFLATSTLAQLMPCSAHAWTCYRTRGLGLRTWV
jgi:hypothetical protein